MSELLSVFLPFLGTEFDILVLAGIGFAVGVLAGFFGMGGGWVVTPALYAFGFPYLYAVGTGLGSITAQSALATMRHRKMGNVDLHLGLVTGLPMMLGVEMGKQVLNYAERLTGGAAGSVVGWVYVPFLGLLGGYVLWEAASAHRRHAAAVEAGDAPAPGAGREGLIARMALLKVGPTLRLRSCGKDVPVVVLLALGVGMGVLAGVMGVGGGFALVPAFVYLVGTPTLVAVGTSLLCVMLSGAYGTFTYGLQGNVELIAVLWMLVGALVGAQIGASATQHVRSHGIRLLYALMMLLAAVGVALKQLAVLPDAEGDSRVAPIVIMGGALLICTVIIARMIRAITASRRPTG